MVKVKSHTRSGGKVKVKSYRRSKPDYDELPFKAGNTVKKKDGGKKSGAGLKNLSKKKRRQFADVPYPIIPDVGNYVEDELDSSGQWTGDYDYESFDKVEARDDMVAILKKQLKLLGATNIEEEEEVDYYDIDISFTFNNKRYRLYGTSSAYPPDDVTEPISSEWGWSLKPEIYSSEFQVKLGIIERYEDYKRMV